MKTQTELIKPDFDGDTMFVIPLKTEPRRVELFDESHDPQKFVLLLANRFESRGIPDSALHD